ncbi:MAG: Aspartate aminotransferase [Synergistales bacterium 53_16]|nr:MAG: Aspartate aminotransferase [Synergistales bacterium 53_16]
MQNLHRKTVRISQCSFEGGIRDIFEAALKLQATGRKVFHLEIGEPDFDSPPEARAACIEALESGQTHYTSMNGIPGLRKAIAEREAKRGVQLDPENIVVTCGAEEALMALMLGLLDIGDEVILLTPCFVAYKEQCYFAGAVPVEVEANLGDHYGLDMDKIAAAITDRTKMIMINSPNNPSGCVVSKADMDRLVELVKGKDIWLLTDECYSAIIYDQEHVSPLTYPEIKDQVLYVNSVSKTFAMTGWRVGYACTPGEVLPCVAKSHLMLTSCAPAFSQHGAEAAFRNSGDYTAVMCEEFRKRRDVVVEALKKCPGAEFPYPQGAFYVLPSIEKLQMSTLEFALGLMNKYGVAVTPGDAFGIKNRVRIAYTIDIENVKQGMEYFVAWYNECLCGVPD